MPSTSDAADTFSATVDEQFLDLICSDDDLIDAAFDAIIAAEWPLPPADTPRPGAADRHPAYRAVGRAVRAVARAVAGQRPRGVIRSIRQRSPPGTDNHEPAPERARLMWRGARDAERDPAV